MTSMLSGENFSKSMNALCPLLPHVAGIIEKAQDITFPDLKSQIESDLERKVSDSEVVRAIENGIGLGVLNVKREFKVSREFTTKEINKEKLDRNGMFGELKFPKTGWRRNLLEKVKHEREKRRNKLLRKTTKKTKRVIGENDFSSNTKLYEYLCQRCKDSLEKELSLKGSEMSSENDEGEWYESNAGSSSTIHSSFGNRFNSRKVPGKSRLLVEKNPMETDPPYYDIFT